MRLAIALACIGLLGCTEQESLDDAGADARSPDSASPQWEPRWDSGAGAVMLDPAPTFGPTISSLRPPPPISGGTLLVASDGTVVAADPDRDAVYFVDAVAATKLGELKLTEGDQPGRSVEDGAKRVHVVLRDGGSVASIDLATRTLIARRPVCAAPRGIAFDAAANELRIACAGGELVSLPAGGGPPTQTLHLERDLRDVLVREGHVYVTTFRAGRLFEVTVDGTASELDASRDLVNLGLAGVAYRTVLTPTGFAMVHQIARDAPLAAASGGYGATRPCSAAVATAVTLFEGSKRRTVRVHGAVLGVDLAVGPAATWLAVVSPGNAHNGLGQLWPLAPSFADGACNQDDEVPGGQGELIAAAALGEGGIVLQSREPAFLEVIQGSKTKRIELSTEKRIDTGHEIFHANAAAHVACASCHPEGGDDGRVWSFLGVGARRTQNLRGGLLTTAPFHWDGKMRDIPMLMADVWTTRMSGPELDDGQLAALSGWLHTLPQISRSPLDAAATARGKALFEDDKVGCAACHSGPRFTNHATVSVGTGLPLQVPSLNGVAFRAPYLHTGCAPTLADRFKPACGGGDLHGKTSHLSDAQLGDLVSYLTSL